MGKTLHIIALTTFLLGIIAPACGFAWGGKFSVIEICTAQGLEAKIVANDQGSDDLPSHKTSEKCQFCFATANLTSFIPQAIMLEPVKFQAEKIRFSLYETIYLSRITSNLSARGPPALV